MILLFWIFIIISIIGLLILATELLSRWYFRRRGLYYVWPPYHRFIYKLDPEVFPELNELVRIEINSYGERGNEPPSSPKGLYRILVAGGSAAECATLDQPVSWPGALEHILNRPENLSLLRASKVHVGNIARSGVASAHLNLIFQKVLPQYRHINAVIINVGGNDVFQWLQKGAPSPYRPTPISISDCFNYHPEGPFGAGLKTLAFSQLLKKQWWRWRRPLEEKIRAGRRVATARAMRANAKEIRTSIPAPEEMLDNFEQHLRRSIQTAAKYADYVLVVRQPWFEKNYTPEEAAHIWHGGMGDVWGGEKVEVFYSLDVLCRIMRLMDNRAAKVATEEGVDSIDLMIILDQSLKTFYDFVHFTPSGAAMVAEVVSNKILSKYRGM